MSVGEGREERGQLDKAEPLLLKLPPPHPPSHQHTHPPSLPRLLPRHTQADSGANEAVHGVCVCDAARQGGNREWVGGDRLGLGVDGVGVGSDEDG
eukprot:849875-Rhodomonas_salina.1